MLVPAFLWDVLVALLQLDVQFSSVFIYKPSRVCDKIRYLTNDKHDLTFNTQERSWGNITIRSRDR